MKKWVIFVVVSLILLIFVAMMGSGVFLKKSLTKQDDVIGQINKVEKLVDEGKWKEADQELKQGFKAWEKVKNRIQFSVERDFLEEVENEMATMKGAIKAKDQKTLITTIERLKIIWDDLGK
ncbi:DUF4363 family protein [Tepidibacillus infernus]|uniref:DUF4363 family protein n=1 Tax=Tepidibacillus TaxID=1494427 RepID=UPI000853B777|nr:DUF4363 family protein [Tepidibacillus sp. HK-1]GBF12363.1 hypothetical protein HK1_02424 [Tepidibacillus sp. HK-1]